MQCNNHQQYEASGTCMYCGKMFCSECLVEVNGKMYCKNDVSKVFNETKGAAANNQNQPNINIINNNNSSSVANSGARGFYYAPKNKIAALLLCFFFGYLGAHRFYVGKIGTGIIWLCTIGFFGIGAFIDFFVILLGGFRDANGQFLK